MGTDILYLDDDTQFDDNIDKDYKYNTAKLDY